VPRVMDEADLILEANAEHARTFDASLLPKEPARKLAVVACMDSRLNVYAALGLGTGDAHVVRNAGGLVTDDVVRSLMLSQWTLGTREIVIVQHTDCGLMRIREDETRARIAAETGAEPPFALGAFQDLDVSVRESISRLTESPFIAHKSIRGFVYDVATGLLREVR